MTLESVSSEAIFTESDASYEVYCPSLTPLEGGGLKPSIKRQNILIKGQRPEFSDVVLRANIPTFVSQAFLYAEGQFIDDTIVIDIQEFDLSRDFAIKGSISYYINSLPIEFEFKGGVMRFKVHEEYVEVEDYFPKLRGISKNFLLIKSV